MVYIDNRQLGREFRAKSYHRNENEKSKAQRPESIRNNAEAPSKAEGARAPENNKIASPSTPLSGQ